MGDANFGQGGDDGLEKSRDHQPEPPRQQHRFRAASFSGADSNESRTALFELISVESEVA